MRRKDRQVTDFQDIARIMDACEVASLALNGDGYPYVVELNFGWEERDGKVILYFHGAKEGTKIALIEKDARCAFAMSTDHLYVPGEGDACGATFGFSSVCGRGKIETAQGAERAHGLNVLMRHYEPGSDYSFPEKMLDATAVLRLEVEELTGKRKVIRQ